MRVCQAATAGGAFVFLGSLRYCFVMLITWKGMKGNCSGNGLLCNAGLVCSNGLCAASSNPAKLPCPSGAGVCTPPGTVRYHLTVQIILVHVPAMVYRETTTVILWFLILVLRKLR